MSQVYWMGSTPQVCELTGRVIVDAFVDGKTKQGPWGNMHPAVHAEHGIGLGPGLGQRYERQPDGRWLKTEG